MRTSPTAGLALLCLCLLGCTTKDIAPTPVEWNPGMALRADVGERLRGWRDVRGLIHSHSYFSHDACDGKPHDDAGVYDPVCYEDFRRGICQAKHDFDFLTDHRDSFDSQEFPDTLLYRADHGDELIDHGQGPSANRLACPEGPPVLVMAGCETTPMMPIGLEQHAPTRGDLYGGDQPADYEGVKQYGALAMVAHTENWTADQLSTLPLDGFEMYNLHANTFLNIGNVADTVVLIDEKKFDGLPDPNVFLAAFQLEDPAYLGTWGTTLSRGVKRFTTMGTDCHRNSLPQITQDGERIDSYRRMMMAFSNHVLVKPRADGSFDDRDLKDAIRAGRLYGVFEFMGYAHGFDFFAFEAGQTKEMGEQVSLANGVTLHVKAPAMVALPSSVEAPALTTVLFKAREGGWDEVARSSGSELTFTATEAGAYRAEVRLTPKHLMKWINQRRAWLAAERPWVYSNAVYVGP
jgi:hypothetical protein